MSHHLIFVCKSLIGKDLCAGHLCMPDSGKGNLPAPRSDGIEYRIECQSRV